MPVLKRYNKVQKYLLNVIARISVCPMMFVVSWYQVNGYTGTLTPTWTACPDRSGARNAGPAQL
jgi:hypothetical protein